MNTIKYLRKSIFSIALLFGGIAFTACTDDIEAGKGSDEGAFDKITRIDGMLLDQNSNKQESTIELRSDSHRADVYFALTKASEKAVTATVALDPDYLETYNATHGTDFKPFPTQSVSIEGDGVLHLAAGEKSSAGVGVTFSVDESLQTGETYALFLKVTTSDDGIVVTESSARTVYLVRPMGDSLDDTDKGPDAVKTVLYFEVNDVNPLNALEFVLKDSGKLFFDEIVLFSANIKYDAEKKRVYLFNNPNVQFLLDNNETYLQPLRKRGMKVILSVLGDWDPAGVAQLSDLGARLFARELASYCYAYNLDGVSFDDEYSAAPDLTNPLFAPRTKEAAARLLYETKKAMPDKTVMVYYLGRIYSNIPAVDGVQPGDFVDYAVADYGYVAAPMAGMTKKDCAGMSIELNKGNWDSSTESEAYARKQKNAGYGYYMFFALDPAKYVDKNQVTKCQNVSKGLYEEELLFPTHYYKKNDLTRYKFE